MLIGVNVRLLIKNRIDGISRFSYETLKRITLAHPEHRFVFFFDRSYAPEFIFSGNIIPVVVPPQTRRPFLNHIWTNYTLPFAMKRHALDVFVSTDGLLPLSTQVPCLPVIHDLGFEHHPDWLPGFALRYYKKTYPRFAEKGKRIATVSEFSKTDIAQTYRIDPDKIDVVYNGVSDRFKPASDEEKSAVRKMYTGGKPYFLFVGSVHPRKNLINTLLAFDDYRKRTQEPRVLLIAGEKYFKNEELEKLYQQLTFKADIIFTGSVDDDTLVRLYGAAHTFVYASYFEGFGIPVVEAMKSGVPVITSNLTSLPEICGDAAIQVNPDSWQQIADAMLELDHVLVRDKYINLGEQRAALYTWDRTAALLWNSIEKTF